MYLNQSDLYKIYKKDIIKKYTFILKEKIKDKR